ncbi:DGQHR domain-containing protein [Mycobacteroides abscessus]|nr:DGQHR domain-containing protein [Mycobacteroides abscessus]MDM2120727.1 DGQHR domain-containing protein [Mycobacteroides abscessus]MDM2126329.1 DGQHR domain-containing protein [Mycobacteroides abscessus]MDM2131021.1 DGQHR domain-containing protein [Mycobacteroides abscessus]MDM2204097.1 DGQHR domain-containing protein [Mycobacteroides abscessus]
MSAPELPGTLIRDHLMPTTAISRETTRRMRDHDFKTISPKDEQAYLEDGWVRDHPLKKSIVVRRKKAHDRAFEDRVWATFAKMGFTFLNRDRNLRIRYGYLPNEEKRIDVFAADDEVVLIVECRSTQTLQYGQFKDEVEAMQSRRDGMLKTIKKEFPNHKVKFMLATQNYQVSDTTADRIREADIIHFDEESINYYLDMAGHLGTASRFQLLGSILAGTKVPGLDIAVPAVKASMGNYTYYSFAIEPESLLKIGYILHRHHAQNDMLPTYQRILQRSRLRKVSQFVQDGGIFPNSIIISLKKGRRGLKFDVHGKSKGNVSSGILHLPQNYQSAYVIDGQHRLYGYAGLPQALTDLVPVIAFVDLPQPEQVRFFMEINENQKSVPKNLRNTLDAELLWDSSNLVERSRALKLRIAQYLGEHNSSALRSRVIVGEDARNDLRCITLEAIKRGLDRGAFIGEFSKNVVTKPGSFYRGSNEATYKPLSLYLSECLKFMREGLELQWAIGGGENGIVFTNNGVEAFLRLFSDIADHLTETDPDFDGVTGDAKDLAARTSYFLKPVVDFLREMALEDVKAFKTSYGSGASRKLWRAMQQVVREARPEFDPPGLDEYLKDESRQFNSQAMAMIQDIEEFLKDDIRRRLEDEYGVDWFKLGVPKPVQRSARLLAVEKNLEIQSKSDEVDDWDCLMLVDYEKILQSNHDQWKKLFEKRYTCPGDEGLKGGWQKRSGWLSRLNEIRKKTHHVGKRTGGSAVTEDEFELLTRITSWLIKGDTENTLPG